MKCHKYKVGENVIITKPLHNNTEKIKGRYGEIIELCYGDFFDYRLRVGNGVIKAKESEIELHKIKIALAGRMRSGKDSIGFHAIENYNFTRFAFGDGIRELCKTYFPELVVEGSKPRQLYQNIGEYMRKFNPDVWVNYCFNQMKESDAKNFILTDLRQPQEMKRCKQEGFKIIKIHTDDEIRLQRMNEKGDKFTLADLEHETEQYVDTFEYDYIINNNGSIEEAYQQFDEIMEDILNERNSK